MVNLLTGIYSKFTTTVAGSHNSLYTGLAGRLYPHVIPQGEPRPHAAYYLINNTPDDYFTEDYEDTEIQFNIYSENSSPIEALTLKGYLQSLYDDCTLTITGHTHVYMQRIFSELLRDEESNVWQVVVSYNCKFKV